MFRVAVKWQQFLCMAVLGAAPLSALSDGFSEDWSEGVSTDRWVLYRKVWGRGNNGCVPELVSLETDRVNGIERQVLVLTAQGDRSESSIRGLRKRRGTYLPANTSQRVGACLATTEAFGSGSYEVEMKIGRPDGSSYREPSGLCPAIWTFHYEEHYSAPGDLTGNQMNPADPQYQPRYRLGSANDGFYSTVNSEIDCPELGKGGDLNTALFNTYESELAARYIQSDLRAYGIDVMDDQYHRYKMEWRTQLEPTALSDDDVLPKGAYYYAADHATSKYQGCPVVKQTDGVWYVYRGAVSTFFVDDVLIATSTKHISPVTARFVFGVWLPSWAGPADWKETKVYVSAVTIIPYHDEGEVRFQPESYPLDGIVPPPPALSAPADHCVFVPGVTKPRASRVLRSEGLSRLHRLATKHAL